MTYSQSGLSHESSSIILHRNNRNKNSNSSRNTKRSRSALPSSFLMAGTRKRDLSFLFLIWLYTTLVISTAKIDAQIQPPNGATAWRDFDHYFEGTSCTVHGGECCKDSSSIPCQGWFCIEGTCSVLRCEFCSEDPKWFCGAVEGVTKENGLACKYRADAGQTCNNQTMPCQQQMYCSGVNNTCQMTEERQKEVAEEIKSRRITMAGMIVVLIGMFAAMRRMLKNEEARRRQIWEPVDSSAEASILRRLAEDTQRRVTGGWGQISGSLVEGGNAASAAVGTAFSRIRNNVMNATGNRNRAEDCDDDSMEMLPNGRRVQSRRELEADMRDFLLEASDDEDEDDERAWDRSRDEDGLLAHQRGINSSNSRASTSSSSEYNNNTTTSQQQQQASPSLQVPGANGTVGGFPDEPPAYDEIRTNGEGATSLVAGLNGSPSNSAGSSTSATMPSRGSDTLV